MGMGRGRIEMAKLAIGTDLAALVELDQSLDQSLVEAVGQERHPFSRPVFFAQMENEADVICHRVPLLVTVVLSDPKCSRILDSR